MPPRGTAVVEGGWRIGRDGGGDADLGAKEAKRSESGIGGRLAVELLVRCDLCPHLLVPVYLKVSPLAGRVTDFRPC